MNFTAEQLQLIAQWLGGRFRYMDPHWLDGEHFDGYFWLTGHENPSNADLFCAIDDKCVADGFTPTLQTVGPDKIDRWYWLDRVNYSPIIGHGPDRLTAAINAVLKMLGKK